MGCGCYKGDPILSNLRSIKDLPASYKNQTSVLLVNQDLQIVPIRSYRSQVAHSIFYKLNSKENKIQVLNADVPHMLSLTSFRQPIFVLSDKSYEQHLQEENQEVQPQEEYVPTIFVTQQSQELDATKVGEETEVVLVDNEPLQEELQVEVATTEDFDFTIIKGIGQATSRKLNEAGIKSLEALLDVTIDDVETLEIKQSWVTQAKELMS